MKFSELSGERTDMVKNMSEALKEWCGTYGPLLYISFEKEERFGRRKRLVTVHPRNSILCYFTKSEKEVLKDLKNKRLNVTDGVEKYRIYFRDVTKLYIIDHSDLVRILKDIKANLDKLINNIPEIKSKMDAVNEISKGLMSTLTGDNELIF